MGGSKKVPQSADRELALPVPKLEDVVGKVDIADGNLPLVVRSARRFGQIVFVGVDLDRRPLSEWEGRGTLVARLLDLNEPGATDPAAQNNPNVAFTRSNSWDLVSGLRSGLDNFRGVTPISFAVVAALILGYIVLIGPGDYFLVKKVLRRMELTWITFPVWVVLVSAARTPWPCTRRETDLRLNQVDLVDVDVASGWCAAPVG